MFHTILDFHEPSVTQGTRRLPVSPFLGRSGSVREQVLRVGLGLYFFVWSGLPPCTVFRCPDLKSSHRHRVFFLSFPFFHPSCKVLFSMIPVAVYYWLTLRTKTQPRTSSFPFVYGRCLLIPIGPVGLSPVTCPLQNDSYP